MADRLAEVQTRRCTAPQEHLAHNYELHGQAFRCSGLAWHRYTRVLQKERDELLDLVRQQQEQIEDAHRTIRILTGAAAWFGAWECGCSTIEREPKHIPEFCPQHGEGLVSDDKGRTKVELNHSGVSGYGVQPAVLSRPGQEG